VGSNGIMSAMWNYYSKPRTDTDYGFYIIKTVQTDSTD